MKRVCVCVGVGGGLVGRVGHGVWDGVCSANGGRLVLNEDDKSHL
jgi:hypothetical protein